MKERCIETKRRERKTKRALTILLIGLLCLSMLSLLQVWCDSVRALYLEPPIVEWDKTYGGTDEDFAYSVVQAADGGFALAGTTRPSDAWPRSLLIEKTDEEGNLVWSRTCENVDEYCDIVEVDGDGYAVACTKTSSDAGVGGNDFWLIRISEAGTILWNRTYGGSVGDWARHMIRTNDGGYALVGFTGSWSYNALFVKTDSNGNVEWSKTYGGSGFDQAYAIVESSDGSYAIAGFTDSSGAGGRDFWLVRTDTLGNMLWSKTYGGGANDYCQAMVKTDDSGYVLAGPTRSFGAGGADFWLVKTDMEGNMLWSKTYGGTGDESVNSMFLTDDNGFAIAGMTASFGVGNGDLWLVKTDSDGTAQWNVTHGGTSADCAFSVIQDSGDGYVLAGFTASFGAGNLDFWLVKLAWPNVSATVDVDPDTLNLKSKGNWITCYIELPEGYDVADIDVSSIMLNSTVPAELHPVGIGDEDGDGVPDLMVKFSRAEVASYIIGVIGVPMEPVWVTLTIAGSLENGTGFEGSDTIRVMCPGGGPGKIVAIHS